MFWPGVAYFFLSFFIFNRYSKEEIEDKLNSYRKKLLHEFEKKEADAVYRKEHEADMKEEANEKLRKAFGISENFKTGEAFKFEELAKKKQENSLARQQSSFSSRSTSSTSSW